MPANALKGRSLTAAAQVLHGKTIDRAGQRKAFSRKSAGAAWQNAAWDYYDLVGEYALGVDMLAWSVSQVSLVSAIDAPGDIEPEIVSGEPVEGSDEQPSEADRIAAELVSGFAGGQIGQQQLMLRVTTQLVVAAESFIVGRDMGDDEDDIWDAYSRDEVRYRAGGWTIDDGVDKFTLGDNDVLIRVWIPSARRRQEPRSSSKALLPILQEIDSITKTIQANNDSRLAGNGILIFPDSVELIGGTKAGDDSEDDGDPFILEISDMMLTPISNRESAAAVVPIMIKVPVDAVGKIQWLIKPAVTDAKTAVDREDAIKRMARSMDLPPEQILGTGDANHWGAWMIAEDTIKGPTTSYASIVVHAITQVWYRPALEVAYKAAGISVDEARDRMMWFDTSKLEQRPDRSEQAVQAFDRGGQTLNGLVRELGLDPSDIPEGGEIVQVLLFMLAKADPAAALALLTDPELFSRLVDTAKGVDEIEPPEEEPEPEEGEDARSLPEQPTQDTTPQDTAA